MRSRWLAPVVLAALWAFALAALPHLPAWVPSHWNLRGEVDGWMPRLQGALLVPTAATGIWLLLLGIPRIDPRRDNIERLGGDYRLLANLVVLFLAVLAVAVLGKAMGWPVDVPAVVLAAMGLLFAGLGNYLPRVRPNFTVGVRTPWTLSSEEVWRRTHRVAGRVFVAGGVVLVLAAFLPDPARGVLAVAAIILVAGIPLVYSYVAWRREAGR